MDWSSIAAFLAGAGVTAIGYFAKRKIERRGELEDLELKERLLRIGRELRDQDIRPQDLKDLKTFMAAHNSQGKPDSLTSSTGKILTQAEMNQLSYEEFEKSELELKQIYERLTGALSASERQRLDESQKAWLRYRNQQVAFAGSLYEGGSIQPLIHNIEAQTLTNERVKDLRVFYEEYESR